MPANVRVTHVYEISLDGDTTLGGLRRATAALIKSGLSPDAVISNLPAKLVIQTDDDSQSNLLTGVVAPTPEPAPIPGRA